MQEEIEGQIDRKKLRFMGQNSKYAYIAMERAIADSGLKEEEYQSRRGKPTPPQRGGYDGIAFD